MHLLPCTVQLGLPDMKNRVGLNLWPKTGVVHYQTELGASNKELFVGNRTNKSINQLKSVSKLILKHLDFSLGSIF